MTNRAFLKVTTVVICAVLGVGVAVPALAGPPLICSRFDIGTARSLPWNVGSSWKGMLDTYDRSHLTTDTLSLLTPSTPIIVRMETLRRAALYATTDKRAADSLLTALVAKTRTGGSDGKLDALALFDAGYLAESYKQLDPISGWIGGLASAIDGRAMVERSLAIRGGDPAIAFAASLMTGGASHAAHLRQAQSGASADQLLARNLAQINH
jgi:hypothetical protein